MRTVEATVLLEVPRAEVERALSPPSIVEYTGTYDVTEVMGSGETTVVTATGENVGTTLEFRELKNGYSYSQVDGEGPFEEMHTRITVRENGNTRVSVRSEFTFGGRFSFLKDWFGKDLRKTELQRLLTNLALDLDTGPCETSEE
jgi:hypothetical protein